MRAKLRYSKEPKCHIKCHEQGCKVGSGRQYRMIVINDHHQSLAD